MDSKQIAALIAEYADNKKAEDIKVLDIRDLTTMADYFVICHGNSHPQMKAISEEIEDKLKEKGLYPGGREGKDGAYWILMDYGDVIVHIFNRESREFYGIEHLWADAKVLDIDEILQKGNSENEL